MSRCNGLLPHRLVQGIWGQSRHSQQLMKEADVKVMIKEEIDDAIQAADKLEEEEKAEEEDNFKSKSWRRSMSRP